MPITVYPGGIDSPGDPSDSTPTLGGALDHANAHQFLNHATVALEIYTSQRRTPVVVSAAYTAASWALVLANAATAGFTVTLPTTARSGDLVTVKKTDTSANVVTIAGGGTSTIDGAATTTIGTPQESVDCLYDGTNWHLV